MPCAITWEPGGVCRRFFGTVSPEDVIDSMASVSNDWRFDDLRYSIVDCLEVSAHTLTKADLDLVAAIRGGAARSNPQILVAMVVVDEGIERLLRHLDSINVGVNPASFFETVADARHWIENHRTLRDRGIGKD
jgi:hypothetical protein